MKQLVRGGSLAIAASAMLAACSNPTVDPAAVFTVEGSVQDAQGQPLANAEVRLVKYYDDLNIFRPSAEILFSQAREFHADDFGVEEVKRTTTGADGRYTLEVTGAEVAKPGGQMTSMGFVEVANTLVVVRDPSDSRGEAGVYTYSFTFQNSVPGISNGTLELWNADAEADTSGAFASGLVAFRWNKLENPTTNSEVSNVYRMTVSGSRSTLIVRCEEEVSGEVQGGCAADPSDSTKLLRKVSAFSIASYYSDSGMFNAYVEANGARNRYRAKFTVTAPVMSIPRVDAGIAGIWAVGPASEQALKDTAADDGNPETRETIGNDATAIYVKLMSPVPLTDAGILNTLVSDAAESCVILEFSVNAYSTVGDAKGSSSSDWTRKGKFCGENGARNEIGAIASFDTTSSDGVVAAWMRLRAEPDGGSATPKYLAVGEVAAYRKLQ